VSESAKKVQEVEERKATRLTKRRLRPYLLPQDDFVKWGYMTSVPSLPGGTEPAALGQVKQCDRCRVEFTVSDTMDYTMMAAQRERGECVYHWGRPMPIRRDGQKVWVYSCCREPRGSEGCSDGLHVFKDGDGRGLDATAEDIAKGDEQLHKRVEFMTVEEVVQKAAPDHAYQNVVAMDCEMICKCLLRCRA
jgi:RNA exonuclease 1